MVVKGGKGKSFAEMAGRSIVTEPSVSDSLFLKRNNGPAG